MMIGCPAEVKIREHRVGIVPASAKILIDDGHTVLIQHNAGLGSGIEDREYEAVGAQIVSDAQSVWQRCDMIVKVKEPVKTEYALMRPGQTLYTFLHLAAERELTRCLVNQKVHGVAYETIQVGQTLPLLKPSSEVAGRMAIQVGAWCLEKHQGGKGMLLGGVPGVPKGQVTIIGGGVVGVNAAKMAVGLGARVTILDTNLARLEYLDDIFAGQVQTLYSTPHSIADSVVRADLVVGAVLVTGARAPLLVTRKMIASMSPGSVVVDVAVDQGGCVETMHATTHDDPIFTVDGVIHYGVSNMPGAVARTSTFALAHATLPYMRDLARLGVQAACRRSESLAMGLNTYNGHVTYKAVADAHGLPFVDFHKLM